MEFVHAIWPLCHYVKCPLCQAALCKCLYTKCPFSPQIHIYSFFFNDSSFKMHHDSSGDFSRFTQKVYQKLFWDLRWIVKITEVLMKEKYCFTHSIFKLDTKIPFKIFAHNYRDNSHMIHLYSILEKSFQEFHPHFSIFWFVLLRYFSEYLQEIMIIATKLLA